MAVRNNDTLAAYEAQVYVNGVPYKDKMTRITHTRTTATADVTTLADKTAQAIPTLNRHEFSFVLFDSGDDADEIENLVEIDDNDLVPLVFSHNGNVKVGQAVNVVWAVGSSRRTSVLVGDVIRSTFTTRLGQPPTKGTLKALGTTCADNDALWDTTPSGAETITLTFAETIKQTGLGSADTEDEVAEGAVFFVRSGDTAGRTSEGEWKLQAQTNGTLWKDIISWSPIKADSNYIAYTEDLDKRTNAQGERTSDTPIRLNIRKSAYTDPTPGDADDNPATFSTEWSVAYITF